MIKVYDNRKTDDRMAKDMEIGDHFMYQGILCRRVLLSDEFSYDGDGVPYIEVPRGVVWLMDRTTWVTPIRDEQICLSIEDWG